jgi:5-methylcytosine-specific restriction endonuclease McrA
MTAPKLRELLIKRRWEESEDETLRKHYPDAQMADMRAMLPGRSLSSITRRAHELGVKRPKNRPHPGKVVSPVFVRNGVAGKFCVGECREWKPLEKFSRHSTCVGGRRNQCTTCEGKSARKLPGFREKNIAKVQAYRNRLKASGGEGVTAEEVKELFDLYPLCVYCGEVKPDTLDHVIPISRGGKHEYANLVPACRPCNSSKCGMTIREWRRHQARKA